MRPVLLVVDLKYCSEVTIKKLETHFTLVPSTARTLLDLRNDLLRSSASFLQCGLGIQIGKELFDEIDGIRCVVSPTTGLDHLDTEYLESRRIDLIHLRQLKNEIKGIFATAEIAWGLLLAVSRKITVAHNHVTGGQFDREIFYGRELQGRTLGVLGYGRLGKKVAEYGIAFGMKIKVSDVESQQLTNLPAGFEAVDLDQLLSLSDVVSIHIPLLDNTRNLIDEHKIKKFKAGAILINTSRGEILDEYATSRAVESGQLFGVGIDVLSGETLEGFNPLASPLVLAAKKGLNVIVTPHIGGWSENAVSVTRDLVADLLIESLKKSEI